MLNSIRVLVALLIIFLSINIIPIYGQCGNCQKCDEHLSEKQMNHSKHEKTIEVEKKVIAVSEPRGFLGVGTREENGKLVVQSVAPNSPAQIAGIKENDIILEINGIPMHSPDDLIRFIQNTKPKEIIHLKLLSSDGEKTIDVKLGEVPSQKLKMKTKLKMRSESYGAGYFGPGFVFFNYDNINTVFTNYHIESAQKSQFVFGGGGWGQIGRTRLGGWGIGGSQSVNSESIYVELSYGAGFFEVGYLLINAPTIKLSPLIGIGGGGLSLKIKSRGYNPLTFNNVLTAPGGVAKVSKGGLTLFSGLAIDIPIGFVGLTLKGGYLLTPTQSAWIVEDFNEIQGPQFNLKGPFITVSIMFGGINKRK
ncbi:MAG: PDZ domain-containing protein [candidate division WOR-3 bacterium]|nr:PDZ domain-containing protein [candidate division WOR-3 bacterium]